LRVKARNFLSKKKKKIRRTYTFLRCTNAWSFWSMRLLSNDSIEFHLVLGLTSTRQDCNVVDAANFWLGAPIDRRTESVVSVSFQLDSALQQVRYRRDLAVGGGKTSAVYSRLCVCVQLFRFARKIVIALVFLQENVYNYRYLRIIPYSDDNHLHSPGRALTKFTWSPVAAISFWEVIWIRRRSANVNYYSVSVRLLSSCSD